MGQIFSKRTKKFRKSKDKRKKEKKYRKRCGDREI
jgi:hypothetical protein